MKPSALLAIAAAIAALSATATSLHGLGVKPSGNELQIEFASPEAFADIETGFGTTEKAAATIEKAVSAAFQSAANKYLPSGYSLTVSVSDIDLAGDRSPLTSTYGEVRVYRDIFPPRIAFTYEVRSPDERLVASGVVSKTDLAYTQRFTGVSILPEEEAPYVAELVRGWAAHELRRAVTNPSER